MFFLQVNFISTLVIVFSSFTPAHHVHSPKSHISHISNIDVHFYVMSGKLNNVAAVIEQSNINVSVQVHLYKRAVTVAIFFAAVVFANCADVPLRNYSLTYFLVWPRPLQIFIIATDLSLYKRRRKWPFLCTLPFSPNRSRENAKSIPR